MLFVFIKKSSAHALGMSFVLHLSLPLMNIFNKTDAAFSRAGYAFWWLALSSVFFSTLRFHQGGQSTNQFFSFPVLFNLLRKRLTPPSYGQTGTDNLARLGRCV